MPVEMPLLNAQLRRLSGECRLLPLPTGRPAERGSKSISLDLDRRRVVAEVHAHQEAPSLPALTPDQAGRPALLTPWWQPSRRCDVTDRE